jgi:hypothetical protein
MQISPRAGQVIQGWERATVSQPRRRLRDVEEAARAAMSGSEEPPWRAAKLGGDDRPVPGRDHFGGLALACSSDHHSFAYQGAGPAAEAGCR